jgi:CheY-like chemotaxis protein
MKDILVIDDEPDVLDALRSILKTKGFFVRTAVGGEDGLESAKDGAPDLILLDLLMPRVSGREVVKRLKADEDLRSVPIIIMSPVGGEGAGTPDQWSAWLGVDDFLVKPIEPLDLLGRVEAILRRDLYVSTSRSNVRKLQFFDLDEEEEIVGAAPPKPSVDISAMSPSEVVTTFVESWNRQDWATEYECMSDDVRAAMTLTDYIARRQHAFEDEKPERLQHVVRVLGERAAAGVARVEIEREDRTDETTRRRKALFTLRRSNRGWQVIKYTDEPMPAA